MNHFFRPLYFHSISHNFSKSSIIKTYDSCLAKLCHFWKRLRNKGFYLLTFFVGLFTFFDMLLKFFDIFIINIH